MQEDIKDQILQSDAQGAEDNADYIQAIKTLKNNTVSKDKYDVLKEDNKKLLDALINGTDADTPKGPYDGLESRDVYYKKYKENNFSSDLEYWDNFLKLRKATIRDYGQDPCVTGSYGLTPDGTKMDASYGEAEAIEDQMKIIEGFVEASEGNPIAFETLMQSSLPRK